MMFSFPDWFPLWAQLLVLACGVGFGLAFLLVPFAVFGVKGRLAEIELQLEEMRAELHVIAARLSDGRAEPTLQPRRQTEWDPPRMEDRPTRPPEFRPVSTFPAAPPATVSRNDAPTRAAPVWREPQPETRPEFRAESRPEMRSEFRQEPAREAFPDSRPAMRQEPQPDSRPETHHISPAEPRSEVRTPYSTPQYEPRAEGQQRPAEDWRPEAFPGAAPGMASDPGAAARPDAPSGPYFASRSVVRSGPAFSESGREVPPEPRVGRDVPSMARSEQRLPEQRTAEQRLSEQRSEQRSVPGEFRRMPWHDNAPVAPPEKPPAPPERSEPTRSEPVLRWPSRDRE